MRPQQQFDAEHPPQLSHTFVESVQLRCQGDGEVYELSLRHVDLNTGTFHLGLRRPGDDLVQLFMLAVSSVERV